MYYENVKGQLARTQHNYQQYIHQSQAELYSTQKKLQEERETFEVANQDFLTLEDCYLKLQEENKRLAAQTCYLEQSVEASDENAKEVSKRAQSLIDHLRAEMSGGEVAEVYKGQSMSAMILEFAKNSLLVKTMSEKFPEEHAITQLKYVMDNNVQFQLDIVDLKEQNKTLVQQMGNANNENANLKKALELATEDQPRRGRRRGKKVRPIPGEQH
jgi:FtsZ-binding cell division protein ZapB